MNELLAQLLILGLLASGIIIPALKKLGILGKGVPSLFTLLAKITYGVGKFFARCVFMALRPFDAFERHGGAHFLGFFRKWRLLNRFNDGLVIDGHHGRIGAGESFTHLAVVAPTGGGKTSRFIIPNVLTLDHCSLVITDPSGEIYRQTSADLVARGFTLQVVAPADPGRSLRYNPLSKIQSFTDVGEVAHTLVRSANPDYDKEPFWNSGAETILRVLIQCLKSRGEAQYLNLPNVLHLLQHFGDDGSGLDEFILSHGDRSTYQEYKGFISGNPKVMQSFVSVAMNSLSMLNNPDMSRFMAADDLDFAALRQRKTALFLIVPSEKLDFYRFVMNLFYTQLFNACMARLPANGELPIFCLMDEFGHSSIPALETTITTIRKYRVSLSLILQSMSQLATNYGKDKAATIIEGGVGAKLFFSGCDMETAKRVETMLGKKRISKPRFDGTSDHREENLMNADRIRTMHHDRALFFFRNEEAALLKTRPFFKTRQMLASTRKEPQGIPESGAGEPCFVPLTGGLPPKPSANAESPEPLA